MSKLLLVALPFVAAAMADTACLKVGKTATARWIDATGANCTYTGVVGSNFGKNPTNGGK